MEVGLSLDFEWAASTEEVYSSFLHTHRIGPPQLHYLRAEWTEIGATLQTGLSACIRPAAANPMPAKTMSVKISHYSDVLCVWAYIAQVRIDELNALFGEQLRIDYRFCSVFGDTQEKISRAWGGRGGAQAYNAHVLEVAKGFPHIEIHPQIWTHNVPRSSLATHLFLKAAQHQLAEQSPERFPELIWRCRRAFFADLRDLSARREQLAIAEELGLDSNAIANLLDSGQAHASLSCDLEAARTHNVKISPTLIFNGDRQRLTGNVGFRILEANVREMLRQPQDEASWC